MANLNLDLDYFSHIKTKRLIGLLGQGAEILPIKLWCHCGAHHAETGRLTGYSVEEIETIIEWSGDPGKAVAALVKVGFLNHREGEFSVHEWSEHEGHIIAFHKRAVAANRKRWKKIHRTPTRSPKTRFSDPPTIPNLTIPNQPEEPPPISPPGGNGSGSFLESQELNEAWERFRSFRSERKPKLTPLAEVGALKRLRELSNGNVDDAIAIIDQSIASSWQGLFPLRGNENGNRLKKETQAWLKKHDGD